MRILALISTLALLLTGCQNMKKNDSDYLQGDSISGTPLGDRNESVNYLGGNVNKSLFEPVYFQFDSFNISPGESAKLDRVADHLKSNRGDVILAGFTDERGTAEYNRALGEKRALAVREYLIQRGADGRRLQTVSFGEEMPASGGSGDAAWAADRRVEFGVVQ